MSININYIIAATLPRSDASAGNPRDLDVCEVHQRLGLGESRISLLTSPVEKQKNTTKTHMKAWETQMENTKMIKHGKKKNTELFKDTSGNNV